MKRVYLSPREFTKLGLWCSVPNGKHQSGGMQNRRAKWLKQLQSRHDLAIRLTGPIPDEWRYIDLDATDVEFVINARRNPKAGGWQRSMMEIFGGADLP